MAQFASADYVLLADGNAGPTNEDLTKIRNSRNRNVSLSMVCGLFSALSFSILQWNVFDAYVAFLSKAKGMKYVNSSVGFAESIVGITSLIAAVPVGLTVDNFSRTKALKVCTVLGLIATSISAYTFINDNMMTLYVNLFIWGLYCELSGSASEALFADSVQTGKRSKVFALKGMLERIGLSLGPAVMVGLFYVIGDDWTLKQLHIPLLTGCLISPIPCLLLWLFRDPHPEVTLPESPVQYQRNADASFRDVSIASPMTNRQLMTCASPVMSLPPHPTQGNTGMTAEELRFATMPLRERCIPYLVAFSDFVTKFGAGMTIKFFPLFFISDYGFSPVATNMVFAVYTAVVGFFCVLLQRLADSIGRAQAATLFQVLGVAFLVAMCFFKNVVLMLIFFILRGAVQNATYPIDKSIIMDYVPSNRRGLWNAVESFTSMTWSGSAVIGGLLADTHDYRYTFLITAVIYAVSTVIYAPLMWLVPRREQDANAALRKKMVHAKQVPDPPFEDDDVMTTGSEGVTFGSDGIASQRFGGSDGEITLTVEE